jgi:hypothetical protein
MRQIISPLVLLRPSESENRRVGVLRPRARTVACADRRLGGQDKPRKVGAQGWRSPFPVQARRHDG